MGVTGGPGAAYQPATSDRRRTRSRCRSGRTGGMRRRGRSRGWPALEPAASHRRAQAGDCMPTRQETGRRHGPDPVFHAGRTRRRARRFARDCTACESPPERDQLPAGTSAAAADMLNGQRRPRTTNTSRLVTKRTSQRDPEPLTARQLGFPAWSSWRRWNGQVCAGPGPQARAPACAGRSAGVSPKSEAIPAYARVLANSRRTGAGPGRSGDRSGALGQQAGRSCRGRAGPADGAVVEFHRDISIISGLAAIPMATSVRARTGKAQRCNDHDESTAIQRGPPLARPAG
jgi:hypothetical protein